MASEWDEAAPLYYTDQRQGLDGGSDDEDGGGNRRVGGINSYQPHDAKNKLREFIRNFRKGNSPIFFYREQLRQRYRKKEYFIEVDVADLGAYDPVLQEMVMKAPNESLKLFEDAAREALIQAIQVDNQDVSDVPEIQINLTSAQSKMPLRDITAADVNSLLRVPGIIVSASKARAKAKRIHVMCKSCKGSQTLVCPAAFGGVVVPRVCGTCQGVDNMTIVPDKCTYVDQQTLKMQESPEAVPTGEMPRNVLLAVDRALVDKVSPGTRVSIMGIASIFNQGRGRRGKGKRGSMGSISSAVRTPYLRVVGIEIESEGSGRAETTFTPDEEQTFLEMSRQPDIYDKICRSISPSISGDYTVDIKKAIACLLFGGTRRVLPDGMKLRGDINVLLLGDPSTAKSQFLKFVEKVAPVGVYTSGKGSSAAGLTASVIRDAKGEFYLEGGAMVLADGGVVCIDEFDKMREQDRVAIHEAMEQQTISVAKAGITTILNSRASVLAAANPVFGTYDDMKSAAENIDFLPTILSRFDCIFIVRDIRNIEKDEAIARHVMGIHTNFSNAVELSAAEGEIDLVTMKKYISYCRQKCAPVLSPAAAEMLRNHYVGIRETHRQRTIQTGDRAQTVPITVRQLQAVVRLAESLAKMQLSPIATPQHVIEAVRLFKVSTLNAASCVRSPGDVSSLRSDQVTEVRAIEDQVKRRIAIGNTVPTRKLVDEFVVNQGYAQFVVLKALQVMQARNELKFISQQKLIKRVR